MKSRRKSATKGLTKMNSNTLFKSTGLTTRHFKPRTVAKLDKFNQI